MTESQQTDTSAPKTSKKRHSRSRRRRGRPRPRPTKGDNAPLHQRCTTHFRSGDQQRGEKYFQQKRVQLEVEGKRGRAKVRGTDRPAYSVGIDWSRVESNHRLHAFCECERFAGGSPCKHIWATLLAFAEQHPEKQPKGKDRLGLRKDRASSWSDLELSAELQQERDQSKQNQAREKGSQPAKSRRSKRRQPRQRRGKRGNQTPTWKSQLHRITQEMERLATSNGNGYGRLPKGLELNLLVNTSASLTNTGLVIDIFGRRQTAAGKPGKLRRTSIDLDTLDSIFQGLGNGHLEGGPMGNGRAALELGSAEHPVEASDVPAVIAALPPDSQKSPGGRNRRPKKSRQNVFQQLRIPRTLYSAALPALCRAGVLRHWDGRRLGDPELLRWDDGPSWKLLLQLEFAAAGRMRLRGMLERNKNGDDTASVPLSKAVMVLPIQHDGPAYAAASAPEALVSEADQALVLLDNSLGHIEIDAERDLPWIKLLREEEELIIPEDGVEEAVTSLLEMPSLPRLETPEGLQLNDQSTTPRPRLALHPEDTPEWMNPQLVAELAFAYGDLAVDAADPRPAAVDWKHGSYVRRDMDAERDALVRLLELGFKPIAGGAGDGLELDPLELSAVAEALLIEGWDVEAHGTTIRPPAPPSLRVQSNVDWFELSGEVDYNGTQIDLAAILAAIRRGERTIDLEDGSKGLVPEAWMETYGSLADLAQEDGEDNLRFLPSQALLVDALLAAMPPANVDTAFAELREKLRSFESIKPKKEPRGFSGTLRTYQRAGLGWLCFLREFGLGGVLADDMGLGKTVQALALLKTYRTPSKSTGKPFLVVAPRSLVYNWMDETERFVPGFKSVEYSGPGREAIREKINSYDLVLTTYGTLRRDIGYLATVEFDTIILDEAQAIKNPESQTAKASRLLRSQNRLALTGTPIENHIGELGSIFEFLNPGLMGRLPALEVLAGGRQPSEQELALVATGIRPFILRRTKGEVLPDLPEKTEQVLQCELNEKQREIYDQLATSYRDNLLHEVESKGVGSNAMQVLEALLRLRQIACHPGLVSEEWKDAGSAKLEMLFEQIAAVLEESHKLVIFSQFTSLLALVREQLDQKEICYAYLDGQTRDRGEVVERFQTDPDCNLFLISLKAGGVGLNLTAASYVFLLDPWWNPAVEAQAIDRAHRIGQEQKVFAYRLIAKDTVEEKMLDLQKSKRQIADAILDGEGKSLRDLSADDLRTLLS